MTPRGHVHRSCHMHTRTSTSRTYVHMHTNPTGICRSFLPYYVIQLRESRVPSRVCTLYWTKSIMDTGLLYAATPSTTQYVISTRYSTACMYCSMSSLNKCDSEVGSWELGNCWGRGCSNRGSLRDQCGMQDS